MSRVAYFAYGSNMDGATLKGRRSIEWSRAVAARAAGWRLAIRKPSLLGGMAGAMASIVEDIDSEVWGVLYEISAEDLDHLELTEGVRIGHYVRTGIRVETDGSWTGDGSRFVEAVTLTSDKQDESLRPTARYMQLLLAGAEQHGLPGSWIETLRLFETAEASGDEALIRPILDSAMKKPTR